MISPTNICPLGCLDGGVNVDVDERGRVGPTTNLLQFATFRGKWNWGAKHLPHMFGTLGVN
jgi:hypothetical protein